MKGNNTKKLAIYGLFIALIFLLGLTNLGYIRLSFAAITTVHIPVIIGAFVLGVKGGAVLGFFFGLTSLIQCFMAPDAIAAIVLGTGSESGFGFYNVLLIITIIFIPRILAGVLSAIAYRALSKIDKTEVFAMGAAAVIGTLTNTVLLLGGLCLLASEQTASAFGVGTTAKALFAAILGVVTTNGIAEAIAAVIIGVAVGKAISVYLKRHPLEKNV